MTLKWWHFAGFVGQEPILKQQPFLVPSPWGAGV